MKAEPNCAVKKMNAAEMEELLEMFDPLREPQKQEASPTDCKLEEAMGMSSLAPVQSTTNLVDEVKSLQLLFDGLHLCTTSFCSGHSDLIRRRRGAASEGCAGTEEGGDIGDRLRPGGDGGQERCDAD
jgi:hypothetical protein